MTMISAWMQAEEPDRTEPLFPGNWRRHAVSYAIEIDAGEAEAEVLRLFGLMTELSVEAGVEALEDE
jgi:hypothetical protein